jgi:uncharacterized protein YciI
MFVVVITYTAPLERIDELLPSHVQWLDEQYAAGAFLASGRRVPRVGGVILARAADRGGLEQLLTGDPFHQAGAASYEVIEFIPTKTAPELTALAETPG